MPVKRSGVLSRPCNSPCTAVLEHRIGGIEKAPGSGNIDYSPESHAEMTRIRVAKVEDIEIPDQYVCLGETSGTLAVVGWGSTYGPIHHADRRARLRRLDVSHLHIR